ncbi:hypothetical protein CI088_07995 [Enterococcus plantarum]|uniref:Uncharacterized protein n=1 Tax=Enterococcus plantarum TaxID=1077675 RepID=A0A2W4BM95_9ENTE|nr:hypothetical protein CI088_07995 [Enterococcus plantarum]
MHFIVVILRYIIIFLNQILEVLTRSVLVPNEIARNKIADLTEVINKFQQENTSGFIFLTTIAICLSYVGLIFLFLYQSKEDEKECNK